MPMHSLSEQTYITTGTLDVMTSVQLPRSAVNADRYTWLTLAIIMLSALPLSGCIFGPSERSFERTTERYSGPDLRIVSIDNEHHAVVTAPTPGYAVTREGSRDTVEGVDVFITIRRPDPTFQYPQVLVEQTLATGVANAEPIRVFVRTLRHDDTNINRPYAQAASTPSSGR